MRPLKSAAQRLMAQDWMRDQVLFQVEMLMPIIRGDEQWPAGNDSRRGGCIGLSLMQGLDERYRSGGYRARLSC